MTEIEQTYSARAKCLNCKNEKIIQIPQGQLMQTYEPKVKCDYCGCGCILVPIKEW